VARFVGPPGVHRLPTGSIQIFQVDIWIDSPQGCRKAASRRGSRNWQAGCRVVWVAVQVDSQFRCAWGGVNSQHPRAPTLTPPSYPPFAICSIIRTARRKGGLGGGYWRLVSFTFYGIFFTIKFEREEEKAASLHLGVPRRVVVDVVHLWVRGYGRR
jgi:hypothetical protein